MTDLLPASVNDTLYRGDTYAWTDDFVDDTTDTPLDLSGHTWLCQIRADQDRGPVVATITVDSTDAATGRIVRTLTAAESSKLVTTRGKGRYYWDLQSTAANGSVKTWISGRFDIRGDRSEAAV